MLCRVLFVVFREEEEEEEKEKKDRRNKILYSNRLIIIIFFFLLLLFFFISYTLLFGSYLVENKTPEVRVLHKCDDAIVILNAVPCIELMMTSLCFL